MIKLNSILNEILSELGDSNDTFNYSPLHYHEIDGIGFQAQIYHSKFKDDENKNIKVEISTAFSFDRNGNKKDYKMDWDIPVDYWVIGYKYQGYLGGNKNDKDKTTIKNYLKIVNTVVAIMNDFVNKIKPKGIIVADDPNIKHNPFLDQKAKIYKYLLGKNVPSGYKMVSKGNQINFEKTIKLSELFNGESHILKLSQLLQRKYPNHVSLTNDIIKFKTLNDLKPRTFFIKQEEGKFYVSNENNQIIFKSFEIGDVINQIKTINSNPRINEMKPKAGGVTDLKRLYEVLKSKFPNVKFSYFIDIESNKYIISFEHQAFVMDEFSIIENSEAEDENKFSIYSYFLNKTNLSFEQIIYEIKKLQQPNINELYASSTDRHPVNTEYYQQVLNQARLSPKTRLLVQGILSNIKAKGNLATLKQLAILEKLKVGTLFEMKPKPGINLSSLINDEEFLKNFIADFNFIDDSRRGEEYTRKWIKRIYNKRLGDSPALSDEIIDLLINYLIENKIVIFRSVIK